MVRIRITLDIKDLETLFNNSHLGGLIDQIIDDDKCIMWCGSEVENIYGDTDSIIDVNEMYPYKGGEE